MCADSVGEPRHHGHAHAATPRFLPMAVIVNWHQASAHPGNAEKRLWLDDVARVVQDPWRVFGLVRLSQGHLVPGRQR